MMEDKDIIALIISVLSFIVTSIIAYLSYNNSKVITKLNMAQTELYIQELILSARKISLDLLLEKYKLSIENPTPEQTSLCESLTKCTLQEILNAYEVACMKYIDDKIDKARFRKTYYKEIRDLFAVSSYRDLLSDTNSFHALKQVNEEWNNLERTN